MSTPKLVTHAAVDTVLQQYLAAPTQAICLVGQAGIGKASLAQYLAAKLLDTSAEKVLEHARIFTLTGTEPIGINDIRHLQHHLALKPADKAHATRVVFIENAERMTTESQNALLKSIEEPPADTYMILTTTSVNQLLPTIMSRVQVLTVTKPEKAQVTEHFKTMGQSSADIERAFMISGGLPGVMVGLLDKDSEHPVLQSVDWARKLLQVSKFERLILIDQLSKDREVAIGACEVLGHMASISLQKDGLAPAQQKRWRVVLESAVQTTDQLRANGQTKLALMAMSLKI
jgi:replication-associated recombination protein RarA